MVSSVPSPTSQEASSTSKEDLDKQEVLGPIKTSNLKTTAKQAA